MSTTTPYAEAWLEGPFCTRFYTRTYHCSQPKAALVFIHGFAEHVGRYDHIHPQFSKHDIALFTFDQRGFGRTALDEKERSKGSSWGKTSWDQQMEDINWALKHAREEFPRVPLFLMGHSMGGGEILGWTAGYGSKTLIASLAGVIASSPLIQQTKPASKFLRWLGGKVSTLSPYTLIPAGLNPDDLSQNKAANEAYIKDPLIKQCGSLRGIGDMLNKGDELLEPKRYRHWPSNLPILVVHGTSDQITSPRASQTFIEVLPPTDKKILLVDAGYHELVNEPGEIPDQVVNEVVTFILSHLPALEAVKL